MGLFAMRLRRPGPAALCLAMVGAGSAAGYLDLLLRLPLLNNFNRQLFNINNIPPAAWPLAAQITLYAVLLFVAYGLGALCAPLAPRSRAIRLLIIGVPLLFGGLLLLTYPLTSTDLYDYLFRGRMLAHYELNTFVARPKDLPDDPLLRFVAWKHVVTAYGPLWEGMSLVVARLAGEAPGASLEPALPQLLRLIIAYKSLSLLGFLLCGAAIWAALRTASAEQRWLGLFLWLWNPLALWETVGAGHNDVWMLLPVILALALLARWQSLDAEPAPRSPLVSPPTGSLGLVAAPSAFGRGFAWRALKRVALGCKGLALPLGALLLVAAGGLIKFAVLIFGPAVLFAALRRCGNWRLRVALTLLGGLLCAGLVAAAYAPFWAGWEATFQNVRDRGTLFNVSWLTGLRTLLLPMMPEKEAERLAATTGLALLALGVVHSAWRAWAAPAMLPRHLLGLTLWFLFVCNPWFMPWYAVWALPLAALQPASGRLWRAVGLFCLLALSYYLLDGLVLAATGFAQKSFAREGLLAALIYGPPLLLVARPPRIATTASQTRWLVGYALGMLVLALAFAWRYPLEANSGGLTDIGKLSKYGRDEFVSYALGIGALFALYGLALQLVQRLPAPRALPLVLMLGGLIAAGFVGMYPTNAIDLFLYAARSRLLTSNGANPNAVPLDRFPDDAWASFSRGEWADNLSPYGPLWNLVAAPVTALSGDSIYAALLGFKLLMLACLLLGAWLVACIITQQNASAPQPGELALQLSPASGALLFLWNPLVLWEGIGNGHNDVLLMVPLLLALWAWTSRRFLLVVPLLVAATLIKYVTLPLLLLAMLALWRQTSSRRERLRLASGSVAGAGLVALLALAPFYDLGALVRSVLEQSGVLATSPTSVAATVLGPQLSRSTVIAWGRGLGLAAFGLVMVLLSEAVWRRPTRLPRLCFEALFALLLLATANLRPWYIIWLIALAALLPWGWPARRAIAWSAGGLALYGFLIWVEAWWKPGTPTIQLVALLLFIGPPLLLTLLEALWRRWNTGAKRPSAAQPSL